MAKEMYLTTSLPEAKILPVLLLVITLTTDFKNDLEETI